MAYLKLKAIWRIGCSSICQVNRTQNVSKIRNLSIDHLKMKSSRRLKYNNKTDLVTLRQGLISAYIRFLQETLYKSSFKGFTRHLSAERKQPKIKHNLYFHALFSSFSKFTVFYLVKSILNSRSISKKKATRWLVQI